MDIQVIFFRFHIVAIYLRLFDQASRRILIIVIMTKKKLVSNYLYDFDEPASLVTKATVLFIFCLIHSDR